MGGHADDDHCLVLSRRHNNVFKGRAVLRASCSAVVDDSEVEEYEMIPVEAFDHGFEDCVLVYVPGK